MKRFLFFLFCGISISASAQDISGIWRGSFRSNNSRLLDILGDDSRYKFEVQLDQKDKQFEGVTYSYLTTVFYGKATCEGTFNAKTKKVLLEEMKITEVRMSTFSDACIMTCFLQYSKVGDEEYLEGTYTSMNTKDSTNCGRGTVFLRKVTTSDFYKEPFLLKREKENSERPKLALRKPDSSAIVKNAPAKKPVTSAKKPAVIAKNNTTNKPPVKKPPVIVKTTPKKNNNNTQKNTGIVKNDVNPKEKASIPTIKIDSSATTIKKIETKPLADIPTPKVIATRENELVKTITTGVNEISIDIYDNGIIDHDTVSVYLDKKLVLAHRMLTDKPLTIKFPLNDSTDYHEVVLVADNLGDIPPNTSLMVVHAGEQRYEVHITSTEQKNAVVIFKYKKQ